MENLLSIIKFPLRSQAINSCRHPNLSMQVKIQPTYLTMGVDFCVYGSFFYPTIKVTILQLRVAVEKFWKKDGLKITGGRNKKRISEKKESITRKREPKLPKESELDCSCGSKHRKGL